MKTDQFDSTKYYAIMGGQINRLIKVAERLYSEKHLNGNEMRDLAQIIYEGVIPHFEGPID